MKWINIFRTGTHTDSAGNRRTWTTADLERIAGNYANRTEMPGQVMVTDRATGMETFVNPMPDSGWGNNIGKDWLAGLGTKEI